MSVELNDVIEEAERLMELSADAREQEGVYANESQLRFLVKKLKSAATNPANLNGADKFVSDLASSDSRILELLDQFRNYNDN